MNNLLVEIGLEEMPARFISGASKQLAENIEKWLNKSEIFHEDVLIYSTPRRLAVIINNVAEKQQDRKEEIKGPSLKVAKDQQGNWSKAAQGFARGQGISLDDIFIKSIKDIDYIYVEKEYIGQKVEDLLPNALEDIIKSMTFPKNMRWGSKEIKYLRPIHWIITMFGDKVIPIEVADIKSDKKTYGHRFLGKEIKLQTISTYVEQLKKEYVIVDVAQRRKIIIEQINEIEREKSWTIPIDEDLLDEVVNLVEYPTVLFGSYNEEFLEIPNEVLITSMREHQRYFPVEDKNGNLLPFFITVRNGNSNSIDIVKKGNEKVLYARLADARFFYLEDQKVEISVLQSKLENVVFQANLGTIADKYRRLISISKKISNQLNIDDNEYEFIKRTSEICKFDLMTNMVYEFPELQGVMGEKYAKLQGESHRVAKGIYEHYLPRFSGDDLPETLEGQIVSISDKIDNIVGSFSVRKIPTGSQDPLGLRRQAAGIVQILLDKLPTISLNQIFTIALTEYEKNGLLMKNKEEILIELNEFFDLRLKNLLQEKGIRYDIIDAVLGTNKDNINVIVEKADILKEELNIPDFKEVVDSFNRVLNIVTKAEKTDYDVKKFVEQEEVKLHEQFTAIQNKNINKKDMKLQLEELKLLKEAIDLYFDKVMVMTENIDLRKQRLGLLLSIAVYLKQYADFSKIVFA